MVVTAIVTLHHHTRVVEPLVCAVGRFVQATMTWISTQKARTFVAFWLTIMPLIFQAEVDLIGNFRICSKTAQSKSM